ncbi:unnamed protein product [Phaedon cochleariae]|uniref:Major facilitator superfamily (MFS) profile domain-containing protein n=1 Tax=Phaedon cochleariae TaxID=80249 RepID=A0A9P0DPI6_PHACE|nr:unnamed protein product [Phaedon cochleariae]
MSDSDIYYSANDLMELDEETDNECKSQPLEPNNDNNTKAKGTVFLYFCAVTVNLMMLVFGTGVVWTSPMIPKLKSNDTEINPLGQPVTTVQISMIAGIPLIAQTMSTLIFPKLPDILGRKRTLLCLAVLMVLANVLLAFARHLYIFYLARSIFNCCYGIGIVTAPIFLNEISEKHNNGRIGCLMMVFLPLGNLYAYLIGPVTSVKVFNLLCALPLIPHIICLWLFVPESPVFLASKERRTEALAVLRRLRSNRSSSEILEEYQLIEEALRERKQFKKRGVKDLFKKRLLRKACVITLGTCVAPHLSGVLVIMGFLGPVFTQAGTQLSGDSVAVLVASVKIVTFFIASATVETVGRRPLLLFSAGFTGIPLSLLGFYFYWKETDSSMVQYVTWLPIPCVIVYVFTYSLGLGPIPNAVMGELLPNDVKATALSLITTVVGSVIFVSTFAFPLVSESLGVHFCIWIFSGFCFLDAVFFYYMVPETKGKNYQEIVQILNRSRNKRSEECELC